MSEIEAMPKVEYKGQIPIDGKCVCAKCRKSMTAKTKFFTYPDGSKTKLCKQCLTMHIDNFDPSTYLWLLEDFDVPYVPSEWKKIIETSYAKDPNLNGMSVLGKYLSKMKLNQFKKYRWADTEMLQEKERAEQAAAGLAQIGSEEDRQVYESQVEALKEQLANGQISEAQYETLLPAEVLTKEMLPQPEEIDLKPEGYQEQVTTTEEAYQQTGNFFDEDLFMKESDLPDPAAELTQEDKIYLAMKWGRYYKPNEWVEMERNYNEMMQSFDIQDADTKNTLILICKTGLKVNQALDVGDIDGYKKLITAYESLRKSAKFTAAQNKADKGDYVDSIGELVAMCEREGGFIPRFCTDVPQDKVDYTLQDMNKYLYNLVTKDLGFGQQIETYIKKIELEKENEKVIEEQMDKDDNIIDELEDVDIEEYYEDLEEQLDEDNNITLETDRYNKKEKYKVIEEGGS